MVTTPDQPTLPLTQTIDLRLTRASFPAWQVGAAESIESFYGGKTHRRLRDRGIQNEVKISDVKIRVDYVKVPVQVPAGVTHDQLIESLKLDGIQPYTKFDN